MATHVHVQARSQQTAGTTAKHGDGPCRCGCAECPKECGLDCLERPLYNTWVLEADDLTALADWTEGRFARARLTDGWGVVCGLDVRCDHASRSRVVVTPGLARGCCGEEIVLCDEAPFDLACACDATDPCKTIDPTEGKDEDDDDRGPCKPMAAVDLLIEAAPARTTPRPLVDIGGCNGDARCEPSREREGARIVCRPVADPRSVVDPRLTLEQTWLDGWTQASLIATDFRAKFATEKGSVHEVLEWFDERTADRHLHYFCHLRKWLCELVEQEDAAVKADPKHEPTLPDELRLRLPLMMMQDARNAHLAGACPACAAGGAVPLARVWLAGAGSSCRVTTIRPYPPFRRPLGLDRWPAAPGSINLGRFIWQTLEEARVGLADLGVEVTQDYEVATIPEVAIVAASTPVLVWGTAVPKQVTALTMPDWGCAGGSTPRIVAFLEGYEPPGEGEVFGRDAAYVVLRSVKGLGARRTEMLLDAGVGPGDLVLMKPEELSALLDTTRATSLAIIADAKLKKIG